MHDSDGTPVVAREEAAPLPALHVVAEGGESGAPVRALGDGLCRLDRLAPSGRVLAQPDVERVEREQVAQLETRNAGLVEAIELGSELAYRLESRTPGEAHQDVGERAPVDGSQRPRGVDRPEDRKASGAAGVVRDQQQRRRSAASPLAPHLAQGPLTSRSGRGHLDAGDQQRGAQR